MSSTCSTSLKLVDYDEPCDSTEVARTMLAISGQEACCEQVRVPVDAKAVTVSNKLPEQKEYPLGLPCLVVDGKATLFDASVINLFLAQKLGLGGKDATELAQCATVDAAVVQSCEGFCPKLKDLASRMAAMKEWTEGGYVEWLVKLNTYVAAQRGAAGYIVGEQLTYADLVVADLLETAEMHAPGSIEKYKTEHAALYGVWHKTNEDERVKAYKTKRGAKQLPAEWHKAYKEAMETCACCASGDDKTKADCGCCDEATGKTMACCAEKATKAGSCCAAAGAGAGAKGDADKACGEQCAEKRKGDKDDCGCCGSAAQKKDECGCGTTCPCK